MKPNPIEDELDAIRLEFYRETKDMTRSERVAYIREQIAPTLEEYNIRTVPEGGVPVSSDYSGLI
jgi:hypothetical protein